MNDWHGIDRGYRRGSDGARAARLGELARATSRLDPVGIRAAWGLASEPERTVIAGVRRPIALQGSTPWRRTPTTLAAWARAFEADVARVARRSPGAALALGGGVDAVAVLAAWRESGERLPAVLTLETGFPAYDEVAAAQWTAKRMGVPCHRVRVGAAEWVELLPQAVSAGEAPLYNLHPAGRFALARGARRQGYRTLVTGDGADAAFRRKPDWDYVPLVAAMTRAAGLTLESPFFEQATLAATLAQARKGKGLLCQYLLSKGFPAVFVRQRKRARWLPPVDLTSHLDLRRLERLSARSGLPLVLSSPRARTGWITLSLLLRSLERG